ncbi:MAG: zinc ribbon domain-containing protein [Chroococcidiopsidaceae cyanobacterium CP_BM_ER_R8_30]|nr:zinc ribbon domain-containing protein [Chroococcidiopsidaceae cyanobacterium CP_BM_ER_R8_30]
MDTASCPHCHQTVDAQAVTCPYCRTPLKAYGHPGIPLHHATGEESLCQSCTYHADDTCTFPQRPYARECTLYQNSRQIEAEQRRVSGNLAFATKNWLKRRQALLVLLGLLGLAFLFTLQSHSQTTGPRIHLPQAGQRSHS